MRPIEQNLIEALDQLEDRTARLRTGQTDVDLAGCLRRLDELSASLPPDTDPRLRHFLQSRSYQKARLWLDRLTAAARPSPATPALPGDRPAVP